MNYFLYFMNQTRYYVNGARRFNRMMIRTAKASNSFDHVELTMHCYDEKNRMMKLARIMRKGAR